MCLAQKNLIGLPWQFHHAVLKYMYCNEEAIEWLINAKWFMPLYKVTKMCILLSLGQVRSWPTHLYLHGCWCKKDISYKMVWPERYGKAFKVTKRANSIFLNRPTLFDLFCLNAFLATSTHYDRLV